MDHKRNQLCAWCCNAWHDGEIRDKYTELATGKLYHNTKIKIALLPSTTAKTSNTSCYKPKRKQTICDCCVERQRNLLMIMH